APARAARARARHAAQRPAAALGAGAPRSLRGAL
ncbi:MAG: hypothetical protein AVDCRST_MAG67-599, partial [uncultured Solirubrobacteraceae bacterium]